MPVNVTVHSGAGLYVAVTPAGSKVKLTLAGQVAGSNGLPMVTL